MPGVSPYIRSEKETAVLDAGLGRAGAAAAGVGSTVADSDLGGRGAAGLEYLLAQELFAGAQ